MAPLNVLVVGIFVGLLAITSFLALPFRVVVIGVGCVWSFRFLKRVASMKVAVDDFKVTVVNLKSRHELELWSIRIEVREDPGIWPQDDLREEMRESFEQINPKRARSLVLTDSSEQQVRVGVAPSYGRRMDAITENLNIAIAKHRSDP